MDRWLSCSTSNKVFWCSWELPRLYFFATFVVIRKTAKPRIKSSKRWWRRSRRPMKSRQQIFRPNAPPLSPLAVYHLQTFMLLAVTSFQKHVSQKDCNHHSNMLKAFKEWDHHTSDKTNTCLILYWYSILFMNKFKPRNIFPWSNQRSWLGYPAFFTVSLHRLWLGRSLRSYGST